MTDECENEVESDELPTWECDNCDLKFHVIAVNDAEIASGVPFLNYCPRCGERVECD